MPLVAKSPDGRFAEDAVRQAIAWTTVQQNTPEWLMSNPNAKAAIVYRFCNVDNAATMVGNLDKANEVAGKVQVLERSGRGRLVSGYFQAEVAKTTIHGRGDSAFIPVTLDFVLLANDFNPLIQRIVRSPENYHQMNQQLANLGEVGRNEVNGVAWAPHLACFVVPQTLAYDPSAFNENSERVKEVVVFASVQPYLTAWTVNPF